MSIEATAFGFACIRYPRKKKREGTITGTFQCSGDGVLTFNTCDDGMGHGKQETDLRPGPARELGSSRSIERR